MLGFGPEKSSFRRDPERSGASLAVVSEIITFSERKRKKNSFGTHFGTQNGHQNGEETLPEWVPEGGRF